MATLGCKRRIEERREGKGRKKKEKEGLGNCEQNKKEEQVAKKWRLSRV